jgi:hypothetical protein
MTWLRLSPPSILWRILLSTSVAVTLLFAVTGWTVQNYAARVTQHSLEEEVKTSLETYRALWATRAHNLATISRLISSMSDVRAAFTVRDSATIRDTAGQLWSEISEQDASFLVLDPIGNVIASLGGEYLRVEDAARMMQAARRRFPSQSSGYMVWDNRLYYVVLTPVYVQTAHDSGLLNVLLLALNINERLADTLKKSTNGSDFAFVVRNKVVASTVPLLRAQDFRRGRSVQGDFRRVDLQRVDSLLLRS